MLKIGDWITQYRKGFWQIIDIKPKYAEEDYTFQDGTRQKKGDQIGYWVLMKKGFTPKMKFAIGSDVCDSYWCKKVSDDVLKTIEMHFRDNPNDFLMFSTYTFMDHPAISTTWLHLTPEQEILFRQVIEELPSRFTKDAAIAIFEQRGLRECFSRPPANFRFVCLHTLWELNEKFDPLYKDPELVND